MDDGWMNIWMDGRMSEGMDEWIDEWMMDECIDMWMDVYGWMVGRTYGRMFGRINRWMDGWVDRLMDGLTDGWTDSWMNGWIDGWFYLYVAYIEAVCLFEFWGQLLTETCNALLHWQSYETDPTTATIDSPLLCSVQFFRCHSARSRSLGGRCDWWNGRLLTWQQWRQMLINIRLSRDEEKNA